MPVIGDINLMNVLLSDDQIVVDRQALLSLVRALDVGAKDVDLPKVMDVLREPFFSDEMSSGKARNDFSMNTYT